jgi:hypothetical protein
VRGAEGPRLWRSRSQAWDRRALLTPRSPLELVDLSERLYRRLFRRVAWDGAGAFALLFLAVAFLGAFVLPNAFTTTQPGSDAGQAAELFSALLGFVLLAAPIIAVASGYLASLSSSYAAQVILGEEIDAPAARRRAAERLWPATRLIAASLARIAILPAATTGLLILTAIAAKGGGAASLLLSILAVGFFLLSLAGVPILLLASSLAPVISSVEGAAPKQARRRSRDLMRSLHGNGSGYWALLLLAGVCTMIGLLAWGGFGLALALIQELLRAPIETLPSAVQRAVDGVWSILGPTLALAFVLPYWAFGCTAIYFDRRVRLEALDIKIVQEDVSRAQGRPSILA